MYRVMVQWCWIKFRFEYRYLGVPVWYGYGYGTSEYGTGTGKNIFLKTKSNLNLNLVRLTGKTSLCLARSERRDRAREAYPPQCCKLLGAEVRSQH